MPKRFFYKEKRTEESHQTDDDDDEWIWSAYAYVGTKVFRFFCISEELLQLHLCRGLFLDERVWNGQSIPFKYAEVHFILIWQKIATSRNHYMHNHELKFHVHTKT